VNHPYIVGLNMAFQSKSKLYFILDYCAGGELFFHLGRKGQFSQEVSVFYAAEITSALHCLHGYGIIYRDLKPENVLLDEEGHIRITDFGLSKEGVTDNDSGADSFCGTPEYLAPEILTRTGHGRAVDWWSLGAILYEMLVGSPPFYSNNRQKLFSKIQNSPVVFPPFISYEARDILEAFLHKNPAHRLGSGPEDAEEVKVHPIFADIDWELLERRELEPPWRPKLANSLDTSQFDAEFTSMPAALTPPSFSQEEGRQALRAHYGDQQPSTMHSSSFYHTSTPTKDTNGSFVMSPYHSTPPNNNLSSSSLGFAYSQNQDQDQDQSLSSSVSGSLFDGFTYTDPNAFLANEANFA
jgi:RAC serine/threonine-protein kinase